MAEKLNQYGFTAAQWDEVVTQAGYALKFEEYCSGPYIRYEYVKDAFNNDANYAATQNEKQRWN